MARHGIFEKWLNETMQASHNDDGMIEAIEQIALEPELTTELPSMYDVLVLNDDFTPMDFVVFAMKKFFHQSHEESINLMLEVHNQGAGVCGTYTRDVAETKMMQVINLARENNHPLKCVIRKQ